MSTAERVGFKNRCQSEVGWVIRGRGDSLDDQTRKNRRICEETPGFGTAKAAIASKDRDGARIYIVDSLAGVGD